MLGKIKQVLGMGLIKLEISTQSPFVRTGGTLQGTVRVIAKSDQNLRNLIIKINEVESYVEYRDNTRETRTRTNTLGQIENPNVGMVKNGETKEFPFEIHYRGTSLLTANLQAQGGVLGAIGAIGAMAEDEQVRYHLSAEVSVEGSVFHPATQIDLF